MATRWQHLLETISIIFQKLTLDKGASYKGVLSYVKDAYMSPIVMLRGLRIVIVISLASMLRVLKYLSMPIDYGQY